MGKTKKGGINKKIKEKVERQCKNIGKCGGGGMVGIKWTFLSRGKKFMVL
jgi:cobyric acid synthase